MSQLNLDKTVHDGNIDDVQNKSLEEQSDPIDHNKKKIFNCDFCQKQLKSKFHFVTHLREHTGTKPFQCDICKNSFRSKAHLNSHRRIHKDSESPSTSLAIKEKPQNPTRSSIEMARFATNMRIQAEKGPHQCDICERLFKFKHSLDTHKRKHSGVYKSTINVKQHSAQRKIHNVDKSLSTSSDNCEKPPNPENSIKVAPLAANVEKDLPTSSDKSENLQIPGESTIGMDQLMTDMGVKTEGPHECEVCKKVFDFKDHLDRHRKMHTGTKWFTCMVCQKIFCHQYKLTVHMRQHTGERPYECEICSKSFIDTWQLNTHMKKHWDELPFKCEICEKAFKHKISLDSHQTVHSGEKLIKCDICSESFRTLGQLNYHKKKHLN